MAEWIVEQFQHGKVSDDGMSVAVDVQLTNGKKHVLKMPYRQLDWLSQALLTLANSAYARQVESGRLLASTPINPAMDVNAFRVLPNSSAQHAIVQLFGHQAPNAPIGMGSFLLAAEQVQGLGERLLEVADQLRQTKRPS